MTVNVLTGNENTQPLYRTAMDGSFLSHG